MSIEPENAQPSTAQGPPPPSGTSAAKALKSVIGLEISNCKIEKKLGQGGMGAVFLARHQGLGKPVALKLLPANPPPPEQFVKRFFREARALAQLDHPNIVHVSDVGEQEGYYYIVMQYIEGASLEQVVRSRGRLSIARALRIVRDCAHALAFAHEQSILHRDIKPDNIILTVDGKVKVLDFGLAKFEAGAESVALTMTGQIMGTPMYMAPEQVEGKPADNRTDIYSLGATGYYLITGELPYIGRSGMDILLKKLKEPPRDMRQFRPDLPRPVVALIQRMMERAPEKRFQSMDRVVEILNKALTPRTQAIEPTASGRHPAAKPAAPATADPKPLSPSEAVEMIERHSSRRERVIPPPEPRPTPAADDLVTPAAGEMTPQAPPDSPAVSDPLAYAPQGSAAAHDPVRPGAPVTPVTPGGAPPAPGLVPDPFAAFEAEHEEEVFDITRTRDVKELQVPQVRTGRTIAIVVFVLVLLVVLGGGGYLLWQRLQRRHTSTPGAPAPAAPDDGGRESEPVRAPGPGSGG